MEQALTTKLRLVTPERVVLEEDVRGVTAMTLAGQVTILPNHLAMVSVLKPGEIVVHNGHERQPLVVSGGFIEVSHNTVTILADTAEHVHELDFDRAQKAVDLARSLLREKKYDLREYETLRTSLDKHSVRVSAFTKWRK
ncbi:MAG: ATP synthase F1 subunit epsilon [Parcubacteria group bacterium]|nr:ATP synthase F1 subunit epsilon [Parcubacteria group bacterium]